MLPDRVVNPGPLTYESGALPIALRARPVIYTIMFFVSIQTIVTRNNWPELQIRRGIENNSR